MHLTRQSTAVPPIESGRLEERVDAPTVSKCSVRQQAVIFFGKSARRRGHLLGPAINKERSRRDGSADCAATTKRLPIF